MGASPPSADRSNKGSMAAFWGVIAAAVLLLVVSLFLPKRSGPSFAPPGLGGQSVLLAPEARKPMPDFKMQIYGRDQFLVKEDIAGRIAVLHIWATWCPPCRTEFPEFARFAKEAEPGVTVIALSVDANPADMEAFAKGTRDMPPVYIDLQGSLPAELGVPGVPSTLLIDSMGRIAYRSSGAQDWGSSGIPRLVEALRKEAG